jgi:hypothetical protein
MTEAAMQRETVRRQNVHGDSLCVPSEKALTAFVMKEARSPELIFAQISSR